MIHIPQSQPEAKQNISFPMVSDSVNMNFFLYLN